MPEFSLQTLRNVAANQKATMDDRGRLETYRADKNWFGRSVAWLAKPFTEGRKLQVMQAFHQALVIRYGQANGDQAYTAVLGNVRAKSLSGTQIQQVLNMADGLALNTRQTNAQRITDHAPGGGQFAAVVQRAGAQGVQFSPTAQQTITQRLEGAFSPITRETRDIPAHEIANRAVNLIQTEARLVGFLPGGNDFNQIVQDLGIDANRLAPDLADKLREAAHALCQNGAQPVTPAQIKAELEKLLPTALQGADHVEDYHDHNLEKLMPNGQDFAAVMGEIGVDPANLSGPQKLLLQGLAVARVTERCALGGGKALSLPDLRTIAKEVAAALFRPFDVAMLAAHGGGGSKTVPLIHSIQNDIEARRLATHPPADFATTLATVTGEIVNSAILPAKLKDQILTILDGMSRKATAEDHLAQAMTGIDAFDDFPKEQLWRLTLDGRFQNKTVDGGGPNTFYRGEFGFENEAGYTAGVMNAMATMLGTLGQRLTPDLYETLHDVAVDQVLSRDKTLGQPEYIEKQMRDGTDANFRSDSRGSLSRDGLNETVLRGQNDDWFRVIVQGPPDLGGPDPTLMTVECQPRSAAECRQRVTGILDRYYQAFDNFDDQTTADQRLDAIVQCCQSLEQSHIFSDANLRNIAFVVMQKLLIENGLSPSIMHNPNVFDGHSAAEIRELIKQGQVTFQSYLV